MKGRDTVWTGALVTAGLSVVAGAQAATPKKSEQPVERPNIIVILSDDMGYSDLGCMGGIARTPNLDALAADGLCYTQCYNMARSCPSRASLLTGLYPHQAGIGHMMNDRGEEGYRGELNRHCMTLAEVLKMNGYTTIASGKWHVTQQASPQTVTREEQKFNWPLQRGFDSFYGIIHGAANYYDPYSLSRGNNFITPWSDSEYKPERYYFTDAITDNAISYLDRRQEKQQPFFLYLAYTCAHWPMQAYEEDVTPYYGMFDKGWDALREEKYQHMVKMGLIDPRWKLTPRDTGVKAWKSLSVEEQKWQTRKMEVYAAIITVMDRNIGRLVDYLKKSGQWENTLLLFMEDNGACAEDPWTGSGQRMIGLPDGASVGPMQPDEFVPQMVPYKTRAGKEVWFGQRVMAGADTTWMAYGKAWANVSNTPFREYKHWVHEGGISTPLIVHWGKGIKNRGQRRAQPCHFIDIMATCVDAAHAVYPTEFRGESIKPMEGRSLLPTFNHADYLLDRPIFFEHEGNRAVRYGKWKIVAKALGNSWAPDPSGAWELYDMEADRTETSNLATVHPEIVERLSKLYFEYAHRANVYPLPKNRY